MIRKSDDYRYSQISTLNGIKAEKERLRRKLNKQENRLSKDWEQIEKSWRIVSKIGRMGSRIFSSFSLLGGAELGYKLVSYFFPGKKKSVKD